MNEKPFPKKVQKWCDDNSWTDLFVKEGVFYAFPPAAVIPVPVPVKVLAPENIINYIFIVSSLLAFIGEIFYMQSNHYSLNNFWRIKNSIPANLLIILLVIINCIGGLFLFIKLSRITFIYGRTEVSNINEAIPLFAVFSLLTVADNWLIFLFLT